MVGTGGQGRRKKADHDPLCPDCSPRRVGAFRLGRGVICWAGWGPGRAGSRLGPGSAQARPRRLKHQLCPRPSVCLPPSLMDGTAWPRGRWGRPVGRVLPGSWAEQCAWLHGHSVTQDVGAVLEAPPGLLGPDSPASRSRISLTRRHEKPRPGGCAPVAHSVVDASEAGPLCPGTEDASTHGVPVGTADAGSWWAGGEWASCCASPPVLAGAGPGGLPSPDCVASSALCPGSVGGCARPGAGVLPEGRGARCSIGKPRGVRPGEEAGPGPPAGLATARQCPAGAAGLCVRPYPLPALQPGREPWIVCHCFPRARVGCQESSMPPQRGPGACPSHLLCWAQSGKSMEGRGNA